MEIDGVFAGGGLKGFALVGAFQVLEEQGYRFQRVAGTSAGAILAAFIAAGYRANEIEKLLMEMDMQLFLDKRRTILPLPFMKWLSLYKRMGLYQGKELEDWFYEKLSDKGVYTFSDIPKGSLKLIASDLTNGKMLVLPDDLEDYGVIPEAFSVARALRMSCGIPFFFEPVRLKVRSGDTIIVDGGVLSNFPLWLFDEEGFRQRPVIGLRLSSQKDERTGRKITNALHLFEALFSTMKDAHDDRYISRRHEKDIIFIPAEQYNATQFDIDDEQKEKLISIGKERTKAFLAGWEHANHSSTPSRKVKQFSKKLLTHPPSF